MSEEIHAARSTSFQIEPEDVLDLGVSDTESMTKFQETLEIVPVSELSKPLESEPPAGDSKAAKRIFFEVKLFFLGIIMRMKVYRYE